MRERAFRGILLIDWPKVIWIRLTYCRRHGHCYVATTCYGEWDVYCENCAAPW